MSERAIKRVRLAVYWLFFVVLIVPAVIGLIADELLDITAIWSRQ